MFDRGLPAAFGGDTAVVAIRRLLEATEAPDDSYRVQTDESGIPACVRWDRPLVLTRCTECDGKGQYVGLHLVERCGACNGQGSVVL